MNSDSHQIFIGTSVHHWNDNRIFYKEAVSLSKKYNVELHAPAEFEKKHLKGIDIYGLPLWEKEKDRRTIRLELWRRLSRSDAAIFHFHDPELIWIGIKAKIKLKKIVIYDIHENVSATLLHKKWLNLFGKYFFYISYKIVESIIGYIFNHFILAVNFFKSPNKINTTIIFNYPIKTDINKKIMKNIDLLYLGAVSENRGIYIIIELVYRLIKSHPNLNVEIIGQIPRLIKNDIEYELENKKLTNVISLRGYIDYNDALDYLKRSKIGLCLLIPTKNYIHSYPTKLFDYMTAGIPVVGTNIGYLDKIINEAQCGYLVGPSDIDGAVSVLDELLSHNSDREKMGANGWHYINNRYNWESEEEKLLNLYSTLLLPG